MAYNCVWCGKVIDELEGVATMDTCEECEDYFEDHIEDIVSTLNGMLIANEKVEVKNEDDGESMAWKSYSLISAIHMLSSKSVLEFKDSKFKDYLL